MTRLNQKFWDVIVVRWVVADFNKDSGASTFKGEAQFGQMSPRKIWILRIKIFSIFCLNASRVGCTQREETYWFDG